MQSILCTFELCSNCTPQLAAIARPVCNLKKAVHEVTNLPYTTKCKAFCVHLNLFRLYPTACCGWVGKFEAFFLICFITQKLTEGRKFSRWFFA